MEVAVIEVILPSSTENIQQAAISLKAVWPTAAVGLQN